MVKGGKRMERCKKLGERQLFFIQSFILLCIKIKNNAVYISLLCVIEGVKPEAFCIQFISHENHREFFMVIVGPILGMLPKFGPHSILISASPCSI